MVSQGPSCEKDLEKFQKSRFLAFSRLSLATCSRVEALVARFTQNDSWLPLRLTREWTFQSRKTLRQIFQNLSHGILATWFGDLFTTHSHREKCVCYALRFIFRAIFKNFSFFPRISWLFIVLFVPPSAKIIVFTHKTSIFFIISSQIFKKSMGSVFLSMFFTFLALDFLNCVFVLRSKNKMFEYGLLMFSWALCMGFVGYAFLHFALGCTWWYLLHTHTLWHDWQLNVMILGFYSYILIWD